MAMLDWKFGIHTNSLYIRPGATALRRRFNDLALPSSKAHQIFERDGAAILRTSLVAGRATESELRRLAVTLPQTVFGRTLTRHKMPERIAGGGWDGQAWRGHPARGPQQ
jgi:hypothetical protein